MDREREGKGEKDRLTDRGTDEQIHRQTNE